VTVARTGLALGTSATSVPNTTHAQSHPDPHHQRIQERLDNRQVPKSGRFPRTPGTDPSASSSGWPPSSAAAHSPDTTRFSGDIGWSQNLLPVLIHIQLRKTPNRSSRSTPAYCQGSPAYTAPICILSPGPIGISVVRLKAYPAKPDKDNHQPKMHNVAAVAPRASSAPAAPSKQQGSFPSAGAAHPPPRKKLRAHRRSHRRRQPKNVISE